MHIYLVRHAEYDNPENIFAFYLPMTLSTEGRVRARNLASWFEKKNIENIPIYTSPIVRCVQTAEIIASKTKSYVQVDERLTEVFCPNLQGMKQPLEGAWKVDEDDQSREKRSLVKERILSIYNEKIMENKDCILVSHGETLTLLYYLLQNKEFPQHFWSPENEGNVVKRGDVVALEVVNNTLVSLEKITDL